jgi:hypothetical protein
MYSFLCFIILSRYFIEVNFICLFIYILFMSINHLIIFNFNLIFFLFYYLKINTCYILQYDNRMYINIIIYVKYHHNYN